MPSMDRELALGIVQGWSAEGMAYDDAVQLFKDIAAHKLGAYIPEEVDTPKVEVSQYAEELKYVESLSPLERTIYFYNQDVGMEKSWLAFMIANRKLMDYSIKQIRKQRERVQWKNQRLQKLRKLRNTELKEF